MKNNQSFYKQAPLPFVGQKRLFLNHYINIINEHIPDDGEGWTIIDAFGGSGLLSHVTKHIKPKARVIYNDFDGYSERLKHIRDLNKLRRILLELLKNEPRSKQLSCDMKYKVIQAIEAFTGYKDPHVLSTWLLFSGQQVRTLSELYRLSFYNRIRLSDYSEAQDYFNGFEVANESFHSLLPRFVDKQKTLFVLDPPYLCTHQAAYSMDTYFDLIDFLRLINLTRPPFIFFSSTKSEFIRFVDFMLETKTHNWESFTNYKKISINTSTNYSGKYEDNLVYKF